MFGFKVSDALEHLGNGNKGLESALRNHIRTAQLGCNGVRVRVGKGQPMGSHVQRKKMPEDVIQHLDKG